MAVDGQSMLDAAAIGAYAGKLEASTLENAGSQGPQLE